MSGGQHQNSDYNVSGSAEKLATSIKNIFQFNINEKFSSPNQQVSEFITRIRAKLPLNITLEHHLTNYFSTRLFGSNGIVPSFIDYFNHINKEHAPSLSCFDHRVTCAVKEVDSDTTRLDISVNHCSCNPEDSDFKNLLLSGGYFSLVFEKWAVFSTCYYITLTAPRLSCGWHDPTCKTACKKILDNIRYEYASTSSIFEQPRYELIENTIHQQKKSQLSQAIRCMFFSSRTSQLSEKTCDMKQAGIDQNNLSPTINPGNLNVISAKLLSEICERKEIYKKLYPHTIYKEKIIEEFSFACCDCNREQVTDKIKKTIKNFDLNNFADLKISEFTSKESPRHGGYEGLILRDIARYFCRHAQDYGVVPLENVQKIFTQYAKYIARGETEQGYGGGRHFGNNNKTKFIEDLDALLKKQRSGQGGISMADINQLVLARAVRGVSMMSASYWTRKGNGYLGCHLIDFDRKHHTPSSATEHILADLCDLARGEKQVQHTSLREKNQHINEIPKTQEANFMGSKVPTCGGDGFSIMQSFFPIPYIKSYWP